MEIYFLRHADAAAAAGIPDEERPLSEEGRRAMQKAAIGMKRLGLKFDLILTSPLLRARQTAEIVSKTLGAGEAIATEPLTSGRNPREALKDPRGKTAKSLLLVGHAPDLGILLGELVGTEEIPLSKGALACVEVSSLPPEAAGKLLWLKTAEQLEILAGLPAR